MWSECVEWWKEGKNNITQVSNLRAGPSGAIHFHIMQVGLVSWVVFLSGAICHKITREHDTRLT